MAQGFEDPGLCLDEFLVVLPFIWSFGKIFLKGLPVKMVQESRAQVNAAGGPGANRPAARRKKKAAMREGPHAAVRHHRAERHPPPPRRDEKKRYFHWMRCTVAGPYSTVRA